MDGVKLGSSPIGLAMTANADQTPCLEPRRLWLASTDSAVEATPIFCITRLRCSLMICRTVPSLAAIHMFIYPVTT